MIELNTKVNTYYRQFMLTINSEFILRNIINPLMPTVAIWVQL